MATFDQVSRQYAGKSLVQQKAAAKLTALAAVGPADAVLDVACGPGNLTAALKPLTTGRVVGIDQSAGMIEEARSACPGIEFEHVAAEDLRYDGEFDVAFCNSALQWFTEPEKAVTAVRRALRPGGRFCVACPGTAVWSPFFVRTVMWAVQTPVLAPVFAHWKNPWFFLPTQEAYREFFEKCGFDVEHLAVEHETRSLNVDDAYGVFLSGEANGFIAREYYGVAISDGYIAEFKRQVREEFVKEAVNGIVSLDFNRVYGVFKKSDNDTGELT